MVALRGDISNTIITAPLTSKNLYKGIHRGYTFWYIFFSKLASGRNPPNPAIWLVPRAGSFLRSCPLTRAESLAASFTSLFVVVNEQNRWFRTIFLLKLALLLALATEKWICYSDKTSEGRIKQVSQENRWSKAQQAARDVASLVL